MDMPTNCPECENVVELNDMVKTTGKLSYHNLVCEDCYDDLENDDYQSEPYEDEL